MVLPDGIYLQLEEIANANITDQVTFEDGNYCSSNIFYSSNSEENKWGATDNHSWALRYNIKAKTASGGWDMDAAKLIFILTF